MRRMFWVCKTAVVGDLGEPGCLRWEHYSKSVEETDKYRVDTSVVASAHELQVNTNRTGECIYKNLSTKRDSPEEKRNERTKQLRATENNQAPAHRKILEGSDAEAAKDAAHERVHHDRLPRVRVPVAAVPQALADGVHGPGGHVLVQPAGRHLRRCF